MHWRYRRKGMSKLGVLEDIYDWFSDIHPKTYEQFEDQKGLSGFDRSGFYRDWMQGRSLDEKNTKTRNLYNIDWSDITYPWLSDVAGGNAASAGGGLTSTVFSANMRYLYSSAKRSKQKKKKRGSRRFR